MEVEIDPLRLTIHEYTPASDGDISLSVTSLKTAVEVVVRGTPFLSNCKTGVSVTPMGKEREQVRMTMAPAITGDEGEEVSEMVAESMRENSGIMKAVLKM